MIFGCASDEQFLDESKDWIENEEKIDWIHNYYMRDKWDIHPDEE